MFDDTEFGKAYWDNVCKGLGDHEDIFSEVESSGHRLRQELDKTYRRIEQTIALKKEIQQKDNRILELEEQVLSLKQEIEDLKEENRALVLENQYLDIKRIRLEDQLDGC